MTYRWNYWSAFREADLLAAHDTNLSKGDTFVMPASATITMAAYDNDRQLSGDNYERATDHDQAGYIHDGYGWQRVGDLYVEQTFTLRGSDGKTYTLAEIEGEGHNAAGAGDDYFAFVGATPPAGVTLVVISSANSFGIDYSKLSADASAAPTNSAPVFKNLPADGVIHIAENSKAVIDINASDANGDNLTYSIVNGADGGLFHIDAHTGHLSFRNAPDFENPTDGGGNNVYDVTVQVSDGKGGVTQKTIWVKVTDVDEGGPDFRECDDPNAVNIDFEGLARGTVLSSQFDGLTITAQRAGDGGLNSTSPNDAMVFDGANPTGGDRDLTATGDKVLIISEDNDSSDPDDNFHGGTIWFEFDAPSFIYDLKVLDAEEGGHIRLLDANGNLIDTVTIPRGTDGGIQQILIDVDGVSRIALKLNGSGAIDDLCYVPGVAADPGTGVITGRVTFDDDKDNTEVNTVGADPWDEGLVGRTVQLLDGDGNVVATQKTDAHGRYSFAHLDAGEYQVRIPTSSSGDLVFADRGVGSEDANSDFNAAGLSGVLTLGAGETVANIDASLQDPCTAFLTGRVFMDNNDNDVDDAGDMGLAGVPVTLLDGDGNVVATTQTDANGNYKFSELAAGDYIVDFPTEFEGKTLVNPDVGNDIRNDSDADPTTGETPVISVGIGQGFSEIDAGLEVVDPGNASLAGRVFMDNNDNSVEDAGDMGIAGVTVTLSNGQTTVTDADGNYEFTGLAAGDYVVTFPAEVDGKVLVDSNAGGDDTVDSDAVDNGDGTASTGVITLGIGERSENNDAGLEVVDSRDAEIAGRVFMDNNDNDIDDAGDMGIQGVPVVLLDDAGAVVANTTTDANGNYEFTGLEAGTYSVQFPTNVDDKVLVDQNDPNGNGDDTNDSDAGADGVIDSITVGIGERSENNDVGVEDPGTAAVGNFVFLDENGNGVFDGGEAGVEGVRVDLLDENGDVFDTVTTDQNGAYLFDGLDAGVYSVRFTEPEGLAFTTEATQAADAVDGDSNADVITGETDQFELSIGETEFAIDAGLIVANGAPEAINDEAVTCADELLTVDVLGNDSDPDAGDVLTITQVDGQAISEGQTVTTAAGTNVTLVNGELVIDGEAAYAALNIGETALEAISYTVTDSNGASATADVGVTFKGDANTAEDLMANLPATATIQLIDENDPAGSSDEAFTVNLSNGSDEINGVYTQAYCVAIFDPFVADGFGSDVTQAPAFDANVYLALDSKLPAGLLETVGINGQTASDNLDEITWILNQDFSSQNFTDAEVQGAIWALTDGQRIEDEFNFDGGIFIAEGGGSAANAQAIIDLALVEGAGFEAGDGDLVGVIIDPNDPEFEQPFIVGVAFDDIDCLC